MNTEKTELTEEQRLAVIAELVRKVQNGEANPVLTEEQEALQEREKEKLVAEEFVLKHGIAEAQDSDLEEEKGFIELEAPIDFDNDENEVDMKTLSPLMKEVAQE